MAGSPFLVLAVGPSGEVGAADRQRWDAAVIEQIVDHVGEYGAHVFAWPQWRNALPGRGHMMVLPLGSVREDYPKVAGIEPPDHAVRALIVRFADEYWGAALAKVAEAYGLSPIEVTLAGELADCGDLALAGKRAGLDAAAVRNALSRLRQKLGARNTPEVVSHVIDLMFDFESVGIDESDLAHLLGLGDRAMRVARRISEGMPRTQVAHDLGMSMPVLKSLLSQTYAELGVDSASGLASLIAQAKVMIEAFGRREGGRLADEPVMDDNVLPTAQGRIVGYSISGPRSGRPLILMHSTITCRAPPSRLVQTLVRAGWRVVAIDRPGFGNTSSASAKGIDAHVAATASDMAAIARNEGFEEVVVVSRGAAQIVVAIARMLGPLMSDVVLVNPTPPVSATPVDRGPLGAIKRRFARSPASIRVLIGILLRIATPHRLVSAMRRSLAASPPDLASLDDPRTVADYLAATTPLGQNLDGYVVENASWAEGWEPGSPNSEARWAMVIGDHFVLHEPRATREYFAALIPGLAIHRVRDAGQMLMYSHPEQILDILSRIPGAPPARRRPEFGAN